MDDLRGNFNTAELGSNADRTSKCLDFAGHHSTLKNNEVNVSVEHIDIWNVRRMVIAAFLGIAYAAYDRALDFWPLGFASGLRGLFDLLGGLLLALLIVGILLVWFVSAIAAQYDRRFRGMASSFIAIIIVPVCFGTIVTVPLFDPWLWYAILNKSSFEAAAATSGSSQNSPKFAIIEARDVSTGIAGVGLNHFVALIYSEGDPHKHVHSDSDEEKLASNPVLTHLYGNFYRRDEYW
ncbi:UNVERIFIED_ORG: hypothetical protein GGD59_005892 [Rhizobium esperanzae]|uniref:hypothetical protein n=1 Tax=Rhizobium phaseoli TaxID=396 RepID=UPI0017B445CA|nr:hypothetical protein [Rhizobium phaseoli]